MKLPFTIYDLRFTIWKKPVASVAGNHQSSIVNHKSRQGVALIITLILLSVVTFMAVTFLALSRRERSAVTTVTDTASARLAADAALASAEAQVIANVLSTTNPYNFSLLVSTNYINPLGLNGSLNPTNVNYDYLNNGAPLGSDNMLTNLANLLYSPRPPVFIPTNSAGSNDFRFYLDLNRNGQFDTNGFVAETNFLGQAVTNFEVGDPEWIGVLERPDAPHGPNNKFIARFAFIALPIGNTLDLNAIYNQAMTKTVNPNPVTYGSDGFLRNQGVGSWEINLAAFLTDLDPNQWNTISDPYNYREWMQPNQPNIGRGFEDALSLLSYRYGFNYNSLTNAEALLNGAPGFGPGINQDNIDGYSDGPLQTGFPLPGDVLIPNPNDNPLLPWAGADNTNHFFTPEELFNPNEISPLFVNSLLAAGTTNSIYEHYTFYRLLSQLGTDSTPESGKMNLNYDNLDLFVTNVVGVNITNAPASTNFMAWTPIAFFTNAADRLLRAYTTRWRTGNPTNFAATFYSVTNFNSITNTSQWTNYPAFGITNIPVLVSNRFVYSSAVNRLLQLAANIYDATTNRTDFAIANGHDYPHVFRPFFRYDGTNVIIAGYYEVTEVLPTTGYPGSPVQPGSSVLNDIQLAQPAEASSLPINTILNPITFTNVYGVPWIIGAKKGFPSFNKFIIESAVQITRKLQVTKPTLNALVSQYTTNQMYILSISNYLGVQLWNSYSTQYVSPTSINISSRDNTWIWLTTNAASAPLVELTNSGFLGAIPPTTSWSGSAPWTKNQMGIYQPQSSSFFIPLNGAIQFLTNSVYYYGHGSYTADGFAPSTPRFIPQYLDPQNYLDTNLPPSILPLPQFVLINTNRLQVAIVDGTNVIDYVQLNGLDDSRNLNGEIADSDQYGLWSTNLDTGIPQGVVNQIYISKQGPGSFYLSLAENQDVGNRWLPVPGTTINTPEAEAAYFNAFFNTNHMAVYNQVSYVSNFDLSVQAPFTPTRLRVAYHLWQANDPLVHYLTSDLTDLLNYTNIQNVLDWPKGLTNSSGRYMPWGVGTLPAGFNNNPCNYAYKDPLVYASDDWDFPTNKFPGVGWLGRVHRGTPWQTVYLKAANILNEIQVAGSTTNYIGYNTWELLTGNSNSVNAFYTAPFEDRLLFDIFTTAFNDNATRGTLSVNQSAGSADPLAGLAAWSALFSGIEVLSNSASYLSTKNRAANFPRLPLTFTAINIQPAGVYNPALLPLPPLVQIVQGINQTRTNTNLFPLQSFARVGDILATPQLTEQSPFLNRVGGIQLTNANDEMYEWLPQQTMSLLRCSASPRYVIYCYGQTLKPAPNAIYTGSGPFFGMVTNYQVVSEIATRSVVRFGSMRTNVVVPTVIFTNSVYVTNWATVPVVTNNNAVIESFNILPPD